MNTLTKPGNLRDIVDISIHVDDNQLLKFIFNAERRYLRSILKDKESKKNLYDYLIDKMINDDLSSVDDELIKEYITPSVSFRTYQHWIKEASNKSTVAGVVKVTSSNHSHVSRKEIHEMSERARSNAAFYENEIVKFLNDYADSFPEFEGLCRRRKRTGFGITAINGLKNRYNTPYHAANFNKGK